MDLFPDLIVAGMACGLVIVAAAVAAAALKVRASRRRARARLQSVLDELAGRMADRLAAGRQGGRHLTRYDRLTEDARVTRTWSGLQMLILRERMLDEAERLGRRVRRAMRVTP